MTLSRFFRLNQDTPSFGIQIHSFSQTYSDHFMIADQPYIIRYTILYGPGYNETNQSLESIVKSSPITLYFTDRVTRIPRSRRIASLRLV